MTALFFDPTLAIVFYGAVLAFVGYLAWKSGHVPTQKLWAWMLVGWTIYNVLYAYLGPKREAFMVGVLDAALCIPVAMLAIKEHSNAAWSVVSIFVVSSAIAFAAWLTHHAGTTLFYGALNVTFLGRMVVVGIDACIRLADRRRNEPGGLPDMLRR